jgi:A1 cistron-splicing factor AAR2
MKKDFERFLQCKGAALVLLSVPVHTEIGIDMHSWTIGPKFKGINLIPPGLHFINYRLYFEFSSMVYISTSP